MYASTPLTSENNIIFVGFYNPPGNFTCHAVDQNSDITKPSVILSWERPTLMAFYMNGNVVGPPSSGSYIVVYEVNGTTHNTVIDITADVNDTSLVDLEEDNDYTFKIYFFTESSFSRVAISTCTINTNVRRSKILFSFCILTSLKYCTAKSIGRLVST